MFKSRILDSETMGKHKKVYDRVYQIGGSGLSVSSDCSVYLVEIGNDEFVMIDCGAGSSFFMLIENIETIGLDPKGVNALILTHCHIDHIGAASAFKERFGCNIIAHEKQKYTYKNSCNDVFSGFMNL